MDAGVLISIALVLVGEESSFEDDHSHGEDVASEGIVVVLDFLLLQGLHLLRGKVYMRSVSVIQQGIIIGGRPSGDGIIHLDDSES